MNIRDIRIWNDVYNPLKMVFHWEDIQKLKNGELIPPKQLQIHPEKFCNNDCHHCAYRSSGWFEKGMNFLTPDWTKPEDKVRGQIGKPRGRLMPEVSGLPKDIALSLPKQMYECGIPATEITGSGEPTLYPYINELFEEFGKYNIETALVTHGQNLKKVLDANSIKNLKWMRFSLDSCTEETHSSVHGTPKRMFNVAINNIKRARDMYPDSILGVSYIITDKNYHEILKSAEFYKDMGLDSIRFSFEYAPDGVGHITSEHLEEAKKQIQEAKKLSDRKFVVFGQLERLDNYVKPNTDFDYCFVMSFQWNVGADAKLYPCCVEIYREGRSFGDLKKQSLKEIIYGEERKKFWEKFDVKTCEPCWMRDRNKLGESIIAPEKRIGHINYV